MLDLAARGGLPVPAGGILQDEFFRICLAEGIVEQVGEKVVIPDPVWLFEVLYRDIRFPQIKELVAVRLAAAFSRGDKPDQSPAQLNIDFNDPHQMARSLRIVWSARDSRQENNKMDILVMTMVEEKIWGSAVTRQNEKDDQTTVYGAEFVGFQQPYVLPKQPLFQSSGNIPPFARRLKMLLAGTRRTLGRGDYQIDWADDGRICWLLQVL